MTARILCIMGSGETAPTHTKTHRTLIDRVDGPAVLLDTPYGFQENADELTARAVEHFRVSVQRPLGVASWRTAADDALARETALARVREAGYVFAGPGSPSYALRHWAGTDLAGLLGDKLDRGGAVTFASAAALTVGIATVPVYEIYKVGADPFWLDGLDLLGRAGLRAAVIPHFDNAEGGTHDTRFCYLGERRLRVMEALLPPGAFVLGVDEHTAAIVDLDAGTLTVAGNGGVTVRVDGVATAVWKAGATVGLDDVRRAAEGVPATGAAAAPAERGTAATGTGTGDDSAVPSPAPAGLLAETEVCDARFREALAGRDVAGAVAALLEADEVQLRWSTETFGTDEPDRARALARSMVVRLGELAVGGAADPRDVLGPVVEIVLAERAAARAGRDWATSDRLRDALAAAGIEVRDTPQGQVWEPLAG